MIRFSLEKPVILAVGIIIICLFGSQNHIILLFAGLDIISGRS